MYKLTEDGNYIIRKSDGALIPKDSGNIDYKIFEREVQIQGVSIVEGATVVGVVTYTEARSLEYPSLEEQQDMQYWDAINGTTTWKDKITSIKNKYPKTQVGVTTIVSLPQWVVDIYRSRPYDYFKPKPL